VPCLQVADGTARTASLTENVQREAMHPADQFEAFAALVPKAGRLKTLRSAPKRRRELNKREAQRIEKLRAKMREVAEALNAAM